MTTLQVPWHLSPVLAPGARTVASKKRTDFSRDKMPILGTWVTLVQGGTTGSKARRSNAQTTPALVSSVADGTVTVLYPNNLVLRHGFKGDPLKRVVGVSVDQLRRFTGSDVSLQLVEKALLTAVRAEAGARVPTTPLRRAPATPQKQSPVRESSDLGERARSRSRSPLRKVASSPKTPRNRSQAGHDGESRILARQDTEEKVCASPTRPALQSSEFVDPKAAEPSVVEETKVCISQSPKSVSRRRAAFTSLVSRELRASTSDRLAKGDLENALLKGGFDSDDIAAGLQRLDDANKIMVMDNLVFLV